MIYIFDLDYTLFDNNRFLVDLARAMGVSARVFGATREKFFSIAGPARYKYSGYRHINCLQKAGYIDDAKRARVKVDGLFRNFDRLVYSGAEKLLKRLKKEKHKLILVTFGDLNWQKTKVNNLKIRRYFDRIIYTNRDKSEALIFLKKEKENVIVINDNARENLAIAKKLGDKAKIYLVKSPHSRNVRHRLREHNLNELLKIL